MARVTLDDLRVDIAKVCGKIDTTDVKIDGIHERLDKLNGSVAKHAERLNAVDITLATIDAKATRFDGVLEFIKKPVNLIVSALVLALLGTNVDKLQSVLDLLK